MKKFGRLLKRRQKTFFALILIVIAISVLGVSFYLLKTKHKADQSPETSITNIATLSYVDDQGVPQDISSHPVVLDTEGTSISLTQPAIENYNQNKKIIYKDSYTLTGTKNDSVAQIVLNEGQSNESHATVDNNNNTWSAVVQLENVTDTPNSKDGENALTVVGKDQDGSISSLPVNVQLLRHKSGDANGDGSTNMPDFMTFLSAYGNVTNKGQTVNDGNNYLADFDGNGMIGMNDFMSLLTNWSK
jgi:hypothetical protein